MKTIIAVVLSILPATSAFAQATRTEADRQVAIDLIKATRAAESARNKVQDAARPWDRDKDGDRPWDRKRN